VAICNAEDAVRRHEIIEQLSSDLEAVRPLAAPWQGAALWGAAAWAIVLALTLATGPLRAGALSALGEHLRYTFEAFLGLALGAVAIHSALVLGVPGAARPFFRVAAVLALAAAWMGAFVYGLWHPAFPPSMLGKRAHCMVETYLFSLAPLLLGMIALRRRIALERAWAGALVGAASAAIPAVVMQIACMYDPLHILVYHFTPVAALALAGALAGVVALRRL